MDNLQFQAAKARIKQAEDNQTFLKLYNHREQVKLLVSTNQNYKLIEDYFKDVLKNLEEDLKLRYVNPQGKDISDLLRGKIIALTDVLNVSVALESYEKRKKEIEVLEKKIQDANQEKEQVKEPRG